MTEDVEIDESADALEGEIRTAFDDGVEGELDDDDIKMAMINAGAKFKNVTRYFNKFMIDAGLAISKADRNQIVADTLEGLDFETEEDFTTAVDALVAAMDNISNRSGISLLRSYAKRNKLPVYIRPQGEVGTRPGFTLDYQQWLVNTDGVTEEMVRQYIFGEGDFNDTSENVKRHLSHYLGYFRFFQDVRANERAKVLAEFDLVEAA